jgi:hypothetical protein
VPLGKDGNDDMFPIVYAVAEVETKESWEWFIGLLVGGEGHGWTIMTDQQKVMFTIFLYFFLFYWFLELY